MSTILLRLGGLVVGIVIARILTPTEFGVYAVALTVQAILMTLADLGLSADIIRSDDPERIAPTVGALGLMSGATLMVVTMLTSGHLASLLGSADAGPAIAILAITLFLAGGTVIPSAMLQRRFQQKQLFYVGLADFMISTTVTLTLVFLDFGVIGLAIGRVAAQSVSTVLQFRLARVIPRFSIDRSVLRPVLGFGLPIAGANLLSWSLLNIDNVILARIAGATALGYYVLAFNLSSWPMSALGQMVRSVSLPYFARTRKSEGLAVVTGLAWAGALPAGAMLAVFSEPLIEVVYGAKWLPASPVLAALGLYGSLRVVFDIFAGFLYASGVSKGVLWIQVIWLITLVCGMLFATRAYGIVGAGWVHVVVAALIILPAYLLSLRRVGVSLRALFRAVAWPTFATLPAVGAALAARQLVNDPLSALLLGGFTAVVIYLFALWPWGLRRWRMLRGDAPVQDEQTEG